jgi:hypothetical protein
MDEHKSEESTPEFKWGQSASKATHPLSSIGADNIF